MPGICNWRYAVIAAGCASCPKLRCERPGCGTLFCYHCKQTWHPNLTCAAARAKRLSSIQSSLSITCSIDSCFGNPTLSKYLSTAFIRYWIWNWVPFNSREFIVVFVYLFICTLLSYGLHIFVYNFLSKWRNTMVMTTVIQCIKYHVMSKWTGCVMVFTRMYRIVICQIPDSFARYRQIV